MLGLAAILVSKYDKSVAQYIGDMTNAMCYESFYKKDVFEDPLCPLIGSRVHLDIVNKKPQWIYNEDQSILIMMDRELHTHKGIREKLELMGHKIRIGSDAELILNLYEEKGEGFPDELNGWF